jgi:hypothetical protein
VRPRPYRSTFSTPTRIGYPVNEPVVNNRCTIRPGRGLIRVQCVDTSLLHLSRGMSYVVGKPLGFTWLAPVPSLDNNQAEVCPVHDASVGFVELELQDEDVVECWVQIGTENVVWVRLAEIPSQEVELEGRSRDAT